MRTRFHRRQPMYFRERTTERCEQPLHSSERACAVALQPLQSLCARLRAGIPSLFEPDGR